MANKLGNQRSEPTLPPRRCTISQHAAQRYRERVSGDDNPWVALKKSFNVARPVSNAAVTGHTTLWVDVKGDVLIVAKRIKAGFVLLTCWRISTVDFDKWPKLRKKLKKFGWKEPTDGK